MVIHFLQRTNPSILPCLQARPPVFLGDEGNDRRWFGTEYTRVEKTVYKWEVSFARPLPHYNDNLQQNVASLGELFLGFFVYFARFNWDNCVVQVERFLLI